MKSAFSDFISGKKGIYGILHIIILIMSLFLVISISVDTFKGIPFYTQSSYMKVQLCICLWFLFDFVLEFFLAKHKGRYLRTHFIFLLVAIPYQNIMNMYNQQYRMDCHADNQQRRNETMLCQCLPECHDLFCPVDAILKNENVSVYFYLSYM